MDVTAWLLTNNTRLTSRRPEDWRLLQPGTYSHRTLSYGATRSGITDGVVALLSTAAHGVVEVQLANLDVKLDSTAPYRGPRKKRDAVPRTSQRDAFTRLMSDLTRIL